MDQIPGEGSRDPAGTRLTRDLEHVAAAIEASPHNLMSPGALQELRSRHLPECLALADLLPTGPADLVDVGSGAGLPGIVIALRCPDLRVHLVEARRKKALFLERLALELGRPDIQVHHGRAEELGVDHAARYDLATARAVAPLAALIPLLLPILRPGGRLYAVKGRAWREELADARRAEVAIPWNLVSTPDPDDGSAAHLPRVVIIARTQ